MTENREHFGSRLAVILAMAGSAIGLGNLWRFPYIVGEHGGAVFIIVYTIATLLVSLPVFLAEVIIFRYTRLISSSGLSGPQDTICTPLLPAGISTL